jgi:ferredoxin-NADP reductase
VSLWNLDLICLILSMQVKIGNSKPAFLAIASPPKLAAKGSLEFLIKAVEGTTAGMLCNLQRGDKVELSQVMGNGFRMDQVAPPEDFPTILLFATGSGIR